MRGEFLYNHDGVDFRMGDLVRLKYDEDFSMWNDLYGEKHGLLVDIMDYSDETPTMPQFAVVLIGDRTVPFEWEDLELIDEQG